MTTVPITHAHLCAGSGLGALGFQRGSARVGSLEARFECLGGIDVDASAIRDFERLTGVPGTVLDLFDAEQYRTFYGREPGPNWREATPEDIRRAFQGKVPDIGFWSPPCKGLSGLLSTAAAESPRYQALNNLVVRALFLLLEAYRDDAPAILLLENVPRIQQRGRHLLDQVQGLLRAYGYATSETTHDCGEIGGLAQHRKRFLLIARNTKKIHNFIYEPPKRRVRGIGEVLESLPMPDDPRGGPMHRLPRLTWETWVRLALIPAGGDWRSLQKIDHTRYGIFPLQSLGEHSGKMRVEDWGQPSHPVTGSDRVGSGALSVGDPRPPRGWGGGGLYRVTGYNEAAGTVISANGTGQGAFAVADPHVPGGYNYRAYGVTPWGKPLGAVTAMAAPGSGPFSVADPLKNEAGKRFNNIYRLARWDEPCPAVTAGTGPSSGGIAVADPTRCGKRPGGEYNTQGTYGVLPWDDPSGAITGKAKLDTGRWSVADPRLPQNGDRPDPPPVILALDGTWHRPLTTLELGCLQGLPWEIDGEPLVLDGHSHTRWREHIGNGVPVDAAAAIASTMGTALLMARSGRTFTLSSSPVWVSRLLRAVSSSGREENR